MDTLPPEKRVLFAARRRLSILLARLRKALGGLFQLVVNDQLGDLNRQTQRLGSASVESATYLGSEVRALDERLSRIEQELASLRALLERQGQRPAEPVEDSEVPAGPPAG